MSWATEFALVFARRPFLLPALLPRRLRILLGALFRNFGESDGDEESENICNNDNEYAILLTFSFSVHSLIVFEWTQKLLFWTQHGKFIP